MAITYSYKIDQLRKVNTLSGLSDVVVGVDFTCTGTDGDGVIATCPGGIDLPEPATKEFTPLASLTEAKVIEWVKAHYPLEGMHLTIEQQINAKKTVVSVTDLPWAPTTTTTTTTEYQPPVTE